MQVVTGQWKNKWVPVFKLEQRIPQSYPDRSLVLILLTIVSGLSFPKYPLLFNLSEHLFSILQKKYDTKFLIIFL